MARKILVDTDLAQNYLNNARIQNLASDPGSPVKGQVYFNTTTNKFRVYNGTGWDEMGSGSATGDVSSNTSVSVDNELVLFNSTSGKSIKRATLTGLVKATSGVASAATQGTDYYAPGGTDVAVADGGTGASSLIGVLKGNGTTPVTGSAILNDLGAPTAAFSMNNQRLTSVSDPSAAQDAATKNYVDLAVQGINWKASVRVATITSGTLSTSFANASVVDGVTLATGDRILIKNQSSGSENGIYTVNASGAPTRATDADIAGEIQQAAVFVREGTVNADSAWVNTNDGAITLGTTPLTFVQFSQAGGVQSATTTTAGVTRYATTAEAQAKSVTAAALTPASVADFARKFTALIGDGTSTSIGVTHGLGSQYVTAQVYDATSNLQVETDVILTSGTVTTFGFASPPTTNQYRVVITG